MLNIHLYLHKHSYWIMQISLMVNFCGFPCFTGMALLENPVVHSCHFNWLSRWGGGGLKWPLDWVLKILMLFALFSTFDQWMLEELGRTWALHRILSCVEKNNSLRKEIKLYNGSYCADRQTDLRCIGTFNSLHWEMSYWANRPYLAISSSHFS